MTQESRYLHCCSNGAWTVVLFVFVFTNNFLTVKQNRQLSFLACKYQLLGQVDLGSTMSYYLKKKHLSYNKTFWENKRSIFLSPSIVYINQKTLKVQLPTLCVGIISVYIYICMYMYICMYAF